MEIMLSLDEGELSTLFTLKANGACVDSDQRRMGGDRGTPCTGHSEVCVCMCVCVQHPVAWSLQGERERCSTCTFQCMKHKKKIAP